MHWPLTLGHGRKHTGMPQGGSHLVNASGGGSGGGLKTMGLTDTAIHWTVVIPQGNFGFPAMEGLETDVVMKCIWLQVYLLVNCERRQILMYRSCIFSYLHREIYSPWQKSCRLGTNWPEVPHKYIFNQYFFYKKWLILIPTAFRIMFWCKTKLLKSILTFTAW